MKNVLLSVEKLCAFYGAAQVLFEIDLSVNAGEVVALMGRNGAGKSTTLKAIMGLLQGTKGTIQFEGINITNMASHRIAQLGLGYVPEDRRIFTDLTVSENLKVGWQPMRRGAHHWTTEELFDLFPNLAAMKDRLGNQMSGGEQQMLTVARTLMGNPKLVLMDEPSEGVAPVIVQQMARTIRRLKQQGLSVLLSEQNINFAQALADRAVVIEKGEVKWQGEMALFMRDPALRERYLGVQG